MTARIERDLSFSTAIHFSDTFILNEYFMTLSWPGNVRQLENTCRWLTVMSPTREIKLEDLL